MITPLSLLMEDALLEGRFMDSPTNYYVLNSCPQCYRPTEKTNHLCKACMVEYRKVSEPETTGIKYDANKTPWDLLPMDALEEVAKLYGKGVEKYDAWNWKKGIDYSRMYAALQRHLKSWWWDKEDLDSETQNQHLAACTFYTLNLLHYNLNKNKYIQNDNRPRDL